MATTESGDLVRINSKPVVQRSGNDIDYGDGSDGNVVISSNTVITRDMYYQNLQVNSGFSLNTNGYRVFVKDSFVINGTIGVGSADSAVSNGTVAGTTPVGTSVPFGLGGNGFANTYTVDSTNKTTAARRLKDINNLMMGGFITTTGTIQLIQGGAGGGNGTAGTVTPANPGGNGSAGNAGGTRGLGGAAGAGYLTDRNALAPGGPGTAGNPGANGNPGATGNAGNPGTNVPAAAAGSGARGGPIVVIIAKNVTGNGTIVAQGGAGTAGGIAAVGSNGTAGNPGANGTAGAAGTAGTTAPNQAIQHFTDNHIHYRNGDGTHGPHVSKYTGQALPHGSHVPYIDQHYHGHTYRYVHMGSASHNLPSHSGPYHHNPHGPFGHHYSDYHNPQGGNENYSNMNGIAHDTSSVTHHRNQPGVARAHFGTHYSGSYNHNHDHQVGHHNHAPFKGEPMPHTSAHYPRNHHDNNHGQWRLRNAGTVSHSGHLTAHGGAGGAAGTAGAAGTGGAGGAAGVRGSTTAGTEGQSGGGGGILVASEAALPVTVTLSASGGALGSNQALSGTIIQLVNS